MLDLKFIREHAEELHDTIKRQKREDRMQALGSLLALDITWRAKKGEVDSLRAERNKVSESINATKKAGGDATEFLNRAKQIPAELKAIEDELLQMEAEINTLRAMIPNIMEANVPFGKDDSENVEIKRCGEHTKFDFPIKNHVEIAEALGVADFEASAKTTGSGFYFLKGDLAMLNQALIRYAVDVVTSKGYTYIEPPLMVKRPILAAAMDLNAISQSIYGVRESDIKEQDNELCLIGTAEHAILGMHAGESISVESLPKKYVGYSMCFRQEIGSHGINEKGLWRTHQFNKVEQFIFCTPEDSWKAYDELMHNSELILLGLKLPFRIIEICTGDLAAWKAKSHDFEVWRPTTQSYGEVMSLSNCTTYQSTDLDIRYVSKTGERGYMHTLNNTALATSRIMVAILENCQQADGSVVIPEVLRPYMHGKSKIVKQ